MKKIDTCPQVKLYGAFPRSTPYSASNTTSTTLKPNLGSVPLLNTISAVRNQLGRCGACQ